MKLTGISPVLLVADLDRSVAYYRDRLGFECELHGEPPDFATVDRDGQVILLALAQDAERIVPNWRIVEKMWNVYIRVDDADAMYAEVQQRGAVIDYTIYDAPHGYFLPFVDASAGVETYAAGRYLEPDEMDDGQFHVDFNMAYNPYCAYNDGWSCPITPAENRLKVAIRAGERNPTGDWVTRE